MVPSQSSASSTDTGGTALLPASSDELPACQSDALGACDDEIVISASGTGFSAAKAGSTSMASDDGSMAAKGQCGKGAVKQVGGSAGCRNRQRVWGLFRVGVFAGCYGGGCAVEEAG